MIKIRKEKKMTYTIDIQNASTALIPLTKKELKDLAQLALRDHQNEAELTIRLVDASEMIYLNNSYRKQNKPTNVLAFPAEIPSHIELDCPLLGDVIICPEVIACESVQFNKTLKEHWSLIVIHGILHLLGFDHIKDEDATVMQALEIKLLAEIGYANPYNLEELST